MSADSGKNVIVIGGGVAGLAAARELHKAGVHATILEARESAGGRAGGDLVDGCYIDKGALYFPTTHEKVVQYCNELDIPVEEKTERLRMLLYNTRQQKIYPLEMHSSFIKNLTPQNIRTAVRCFTLGGLAQFGKYARFVKKRADDFSAHDHTRLLDLDVEGSFGDWARESYGAKLVDDYTYASFASVTLANADLISPLHGMMLLHDPWFEKGLVMAAPRGGVANLTRTFADASKDYTRLATPVERVVVEDGVAKGVVTQNGTMEADAVVCATDAHDALKIIPDLPDPVRSVLGEMNYSKCCHVVFGIEFNPIQDGHWNFTFQTGGSSFLSIYLDTAQNAPGSAPEGMSVIHAYVDNDFSEEMSKLDDDEIKRKVIKEIQRFSPAMPDEPAFTRIYRWDRAVCLPGGGAMKKLHTLQSEGFPGVQGLFMCGEYMSMISCMNGAMTTGQAAASDVVSYFA